MAEVDYSLPPWITNPGQQYADTILRARQLQGQEQDRKFRQGNEATEEAMRQQEFNQQAQATAAKYAQQQAFQQGYQQIMSDPKYATDPASQSRAIAMLAIQTGQGGAGAFNLLKPQTPPRGTVVTSGAAFIPPGDKLPSFQNPAKPANPPAGFTLTQPGSTRFGADGKPIASLPSRPTPEAPTSIPEIPVVGADGKPDPDLVGTWNGKTIQILKRQEGQVTPREKFEAQQKKTAISVLENQSKKLQKLLDDDKYLNEQAGGDAAKRKQISTKMEAQKADIDAKIEQLESGVEGNAPADASPAGLPPGVTVKRLP